MLEKRYAERRDKMHYRAVMDVIMRANDEEMEAKKMVPHEVWEKVVLEIGEEQGETRMGQLAEKLIAASRLPDFLQAIKDRDFRQKMYEELGIERNA